MNFDGFEAAMLIEVQQSPPFLLPMESDDGPTLQDALAKSVAATPPGPRLDDEPSGLGNTSPTLFRALSPELRPLSPDDMLLLAGGRGSEFTVTGPDPWDPTLPNDPDPDGPYGNGGGGGGQTGSWTSSEQVADHQQDCGTEDGAVVQVAKHVKGTPPGAGPDNPLISGGADWTHIEYGAVIARNPDGSFGALNDAIYSNGAPNYVLLPISGGADIQGLWHNHITSADPIQQMVNRYPSVYEPNERSDWTMLQDLKDHVAPNDPDYDPSMWITGPDGATREFKLSERSYFEGLSREQMQAGEGLAGRERTQSCG